MISPSLIMTVHALSDEDRRDLIAHAAGVQGFKDGDGGIKIAKALRNIADRLTGQPRKAAA